jgi:DNA-binding response OmpR family regulator
VLSKRRRKYASVSEGAQVMRKKMVMIVDSDTAYLDELKSFMQADGFDVETLTDGAATVKMAEEKQPDIILLDMKMPGKSGFQVADDLKQFLATSHIPIIAMTSHFTESQHKTFMISLGISDCIIKPADPLEVISKIRQFILEPESAVNISNTLSNGK